VNGLTSQVLPALLLSLLLTAAVVTAAVLGTWLHRKITRRGRRKRAAV
jgi:hypothetical protein